MAFQFIRLEGYGVRPGRFRKPQETAQDVLAEAARTGGSTPHIRRPTTPNLLHGAVPSELQGHLEQLRQVARDKRGAKLRTTSTLLYAIVASYPTAWRHLGSQEDRQRYEAWLRATKMWLVDQFGDQLFSVVEHVDEPYPHIHAFAFPRLDTRNRLDHSLHPGYAARQQAAETGADAKDRERAYRRGMRSWQDDYHQCVSQNFGHGRLGPRRQRFRRDAALVRRSLDQVLEVAGFLASNVLALIGSPNQTVVEQEGHFERLAALNGLIEETRNNLARGRTDAIRELDAGLRVFVAGQQGSQPSIVQENQAIALAEEEVDIVSDEAWDDDDDPRPEDFDEDVESYEDAPREALDSESTEGPDGEVEWEHVEYGWDVLEDEGDW